MKTITVRQALKEGYKFYGEKGVEEYRFLQDIKDEFDLEAEIKRHGELYLANKECKIYSFPDKDSVVELITDHISDECYEGAYDSIYDIVSDYGLDFQDILDKIKDEIKEKNATHTYESTDIKITKY